MRLPYSTPFSLNAPLDASAVSARLRSGVSRYRAATASRVKGSVHADRCVLKGPIPPFTRNSFARVLELRFYPSANGTELRGRFRLNWPVFYFMCFWFGSLLIATPVELVAAVSQQGLSVFMSEPERLVPVVLILMGLGMTEFGVRLSRSSEEKVVEFLHQALDQPQDICGIG